VKERNEATNGSGTASRIGAKFGRTDTVVSNVVTHTIEVRRMYTRTPVEESLIKVVTDLVRGFQGKYKLSLIDQAGESKWYRPVGQYPCDISIMFELTGPDHAPDDPDYNQTLSLFATRLNQVKTGKTPKYYPYGLDGDEWKALDPRALMQARANKLEGMVEYADVEMPSDEMLEVGMDGLFNLDNQIDMVVTALQRAIEGGFKFRDHQLLIGEPGCGKSETLSRIYNMLDAMGFGSAVLKIDGTAMTSAGIIELLKNIPIMPRIMMVEELDKATNDAVAVFLGLMDKRGEVRKITYRDQFNRDGRMLVLATANSFEKIQRMQEGAVLSRFGNPVHYERVKEDGLRRILHRELNEQDLAICCKPVITKNKRGEEVQNECGNCKECKRRNKWIDATLRWCKEHEGKLVIDTMDPRFVIKMCVAGQDKLDGRYQRSLEATSMKIEDF